MSVRSTTGSRVSDPEERSAEGPTIRSRTVGRFLAAQGLASGPEREDFLTPRLLKLTSPTMMQGRDVAAERIARAIEGGERIAIFGDYDCDGMTATAILADAVEGLGGKVQTFLASRFSGGYGFSLEALERVLRSGASLLVTCDCGSSDHETLQRLQAEGVDALVVDHHLVPERPLPVLSFLNPHQPSCQFPFKHLASCGLVFHLAAAIRQRLGRKVDLRPLLELVAIGSIADVVPLVGDNRILVRAGLTRLMNPSRPGLVALMDVLGFERNQPVTAQDVAFRIAPRLNAPGRLGSPDLALELLRERDLKRARVLAETIDGLSQKRRALQDDILAQAEAQVEAGGFGGAPAIVVWDDSWNHGIVGIVAGRLADKYEKPVIVVGFDADLGTGSVRGPKGFPLFDAVSTCAALVERFGGHQAACGVSVRRERLVALREQFTLACSRLTAEELPDAAPCLDFDPEDDFRAVLSDLLALEPCGQDNPAPLLRVRGVVQNVREVRGGHLRLELDVGRAGSIVGFGPNLGNWASLLSETATVEGQLRPDRYRGGGAVELLLTAVSAS